MLFFLLSILTAVNYRIIFDDTEPNRISFKCAKLFKNVKSLKLKEHIHSFILAKGQCHDSEYRDYHLFNEWLNKTDKREIRILDMNVDYSTMEGTFSLDIVDEDIKEIFTEGKTLVVKLGDKYLFHAFLKVCHSRLSMRKDQFIQKEDGIDMPVDANSLLF